MLDMQIHISMCIEKDASSAVSKSMRPAYQMQAAMWKSRLIPNSKSRWESHVIYHRISEMQQTSIDDYATTAMKTTTWSKEGLEGRLLKFIISCNMVCLFL